MLLWRRYHNHNSIPSLSRISLQQVSPWSKIPSKSIVHIRHSCRSSSFTTTTTGKAAPFHLPAPTWSLHDLCLTTTSTTTTKTTTTTPITVHQQETNDATITTTTSSNKDRTVSRDQLRILAKRAVLDLDYLQQQQKQQDEGDEENSAQVEALQRNVETMLHMMHVVETIPLPVDLSAHEIYDVPRGVTHAPLRTISHGYNDSHTICHDGLKQVNDNNININNNDNTSHNIDDERDAKEVWKSFLQPKTVKLGGHSYFRIVTKHSPNTTTSS